MATRGIRRLATALLLATSLFGVAACSQGDEVVYENQENTENTKIEDRKKGTIKYSFEAPPTLENKAVAAIENMRKVEDTGEFGIIATAADEQKLYRIINGEAIWLSDAEGGKIIDAAFVQGSGRIWTVVVREKDSKTKTVSVYDAYSYGKDAVPLRKADFADSNVYLNDYGVVIQSSKETKRYYPATGLSATVTLPEKSSLLAPTSNGYLVTENNLVALATTDNATGWHSANHRPEGVSVNASSRLVGRSNSLVALEWVDGDTRHLSFHNSTTGEVIVSTDDPPELPEGYNSEIGFADSTTIAFFHNLVIDISNQKITEFDQPVVAIMDNIVYLANGEGKDVADQTNLWNDPSSDPVLLGFSQRQGLYQQGETLYLLNLVYIPGTEETEKPTSAKPSK